MSPQTSVYSLLRVPLPTAMFPHDQSLTSKEDEGGGLGGLVAVGHDALVHPGVALLHREDPQLCSQLSFGPGQRKKRKCVHRKRSNDVVD